MSWWRARPVAAFAIRSLIFLTPLVVSFATCYAIARAIRQPAGFLPGLSWWVALVLVSTAAMFVVDRLARRLLPLSALLRMTLVFPNERPSRFGVALRTGTTRQLQRRVDEVRANGLGNDETSAAETLLQLVALVGQHDRFTRGHGERVRAFSALIGEELGLSAVEVSKLQWAGLIHDVGKLAVPDAILNKPGKLTDEEFEIIKTHPAAGMALVGPLTDWLGEWVLAVGEHHERWDGTGYPAGRAGTDISLAGRIVAVADTFDVITATRSYKAGQSPHAARAELERHAGSQFDPNVVRAFLAISLGRVRSVMWPLSWVANLRFIGSSVTAPAANVIAPVLFAAGSAITGGAIAAHNAPPPETPITVEAELTAPGFDTAVISLSDPESPARSNRQSDDSTDRMGTERLVDGTPSIGSVAPTTTSSASTTTTSSSTTTTTMLVVVLPTPGAPTAEAAPNDHLTSPASATQTTSAPRSTVVVTTLPATRVPTTAAPTTAAPKAAAPTTAAPTTAAPTTAAPTTVAPTDCERARANQNDLAGTDLSGCDLSGLTLTQVDLSGADLSGADLSGLTLRWFNLDNADLTDANLSGSSLNDGSLRNTAAAALTANGLTLSRIDLAASDLTGADFTNASISEVSFTLVQATGASFVGASFFNTNFNDADISRTDFRTATGSDIEFARSVAFDADFSAARLTRVRFTDAHLRGAQLAYAELTESGVQNADLALADFTRTDLSRGYGTPVNAGSATFASTLCPDNTTRSTTCWP